MARYFDMDVQATRFNWYRDSSEWKPFHHDAAAMKEKFARTQNFTLAVSFGAEREAAFEHAKVRYLPTIFLKIWQMNYSCKNDPIPLVLLVSDRSLSSRFM